MTEEEEEARERELQMHRGNEARRILSEPLFVEIMDSLESRYLMGMRRAPTSNPAQMEVVMRTFRFRLEALDLIRGELRHFVDNGMIAAVEAEQAEPDGLSGEESEN